MDFDAARAEVLRILDAPLSTLTDDGRLGVPPPAALDEWDLPEADRAALRAHGLPPARSDDVFGVVASYQAGRPPELDDDGVALYQLGEFGTARLGAAPGSGAVLAVPRHREVHPQLRHLHPEGILSTVVNTRVTHLVTAAWRWHWLAPLLAGQQVQAGDAEQAAWQGARTTAEQAALPDFHAGVRHVCQEIVDRFRAEDAEAVDGAGSFWSDTILADL